MVIDRRGPVELTARFDIDLPIGSIPREFIKQTDGNYLWFENSLEQEAETFHFASVTLGSKVPEFARYMHMHLAKKNKAVYQVG